MSQYVIGLAGLVGRVLRFPISAHTKAPFCDMNTAGSQGHWGKRRENAKWPPVTSPP